MNTNQNFSEDYTNDTVDEQLLRDVIQDELDNIDQPDLDKLWDSIEDKLDDYTIKRKSSLKFSSVIISLVTIAIAIIYVLYRF